MEVKKLAFPLPEQEESNTCGPRSLCNALLLLGIDCSEEEVSKLAQLEEEGTTAEGLAKAAAHYGFALEEISLKGEDEFPAFWDLLVEAMVARFPMILMVDNFQHWILATDITLDGTKIIINDPNGQGDGEYDSEALMARAWNQDEEGEMESEFYGLVLIPEAALEGEEDESEAEMDHPEDEGEANGEDN